jgi:ribosome maturation factor RimP
MQTMSATNIQQQITDRLAADEPDVEVLLVDVTRGGVVRLFIDHPDGVTLALCERVTRHLSDLRTEYGLEVSSPGLDRPLAKPEHFRRFLGRRAKVRLREPIEGPEGRRARSVTGELVGADDRTVTVGTPGGVVAIPYADIHRSNLVGE